MRFWKAVLTVAWVLVFSSTGWAKIDTVRMTDFAFVPASLAIRPGDTVVWKSTQQCCDAHTTTRNGLFSWNSGPVPLNGTFLQAFPDAGRFDYECTPHAGIGMVGTVNVVSTVPSTSWAGLVLLLASLSATAIWTLQRKKEAAPIRR